MSHKEQENNFGFDINLYSRQLGVIDIETMKKFNKIDILIIGLRGLGVEILKNLILEGPKSVDIYDPNYININDLNSNFFINEEDISKIRDEIIIERIKDLNPNVKSKIIKQNIYDEDNNYEIELNFILSNIQNYSIIIFTEFALKNTIVKINNECRKLNKKFIYACALGLSGFLFNDFGQNHIISSPYDKDDKFYPIKNIIKGEKTIIQIDSSSEGFPNLGDNGYIKIIDLKGMLELNKDIIYKAKFISLSEYEIDINSNNFNDYTYGGFIQIISLPQKIEFKTFEQDILNPMKDKEREIIDIPYIGRNDIVHSLIIALNNSENKLDNTIHKRSYIIDSEILPQLNDEKNAKKLTESAKLYYNISKENKEKWIQIVDIYDETSEQKEFDEEMAKNICLYLAAELPPIVSFLGGVVAQEVIKITGEFSPFNQWFEFEFNYLSREFNNHSKEENNEISRYNEQIKIFGKEVQDKINSLNVFLIGAGAIGCEYIKNFSMMGISCKNNKKNGTLSITDFDKIELSNLNRQFLFRENNIGQFKSEVCKYFAKKMNNSININSYLNIVSSETENVFSDIFWDNQDIIFNAVDNIKARIYINEKVTIHQKYHVDAGTLGVNSSSCFFLKNISSTYKEQNEDKKENNQNNRETGMCTIHSFPTNISHCIEWARNEYEYLFKEFINELNQIIQGNYMFLYKILFKKIFPFYKMEKLKEIEDFFDILISKSYEKAIKYAFLNFKNKFNFQINNILKEHPENSKDENGNYFYSGSKHSPIVLDLNINDEIDNLIICYVKSYANLIFDNLDLIKSEEEKYFNDNKIKEICLKTEIKNYDGVNKKSMDCKIKYDKEFCQNFINDLHNKLVAQLSLKSLEEIKIKEIIFMKDSIKNSQYDFIYSCSNLRALNFQIPQCDFIKIKNISSNIVPSIVTSNAVITGLVSMQLYLLAKLLVEKENYNNNILESEEALKLFRNYYINMGLNGYIYSYLPTKILHNEKNDYPKDWSEWDCIILNGPLKVYEFIDKIEEKYEVIIKSIHSGKSMIYNISDPKEMRNLEIEELYKKITEKVLNENNKYLIFNLIVNTKDGLDARMPKIKYNLKFK